MFVHRELAVAATDTHYVDYGNWNEYEPLTLSVDHGSDGTIDEVIQIENQVGRIYLPITLRTQVSDGTRRLVRGEN